MNLVILSLSQIVAGIISLAICAFIAFTTRKQRIKAPPSKLAELAYQNLNNNTASLIQHESNSLIDWKESNVLVLAYSTGLFCWPSSSNSGPWSHRCVQTPLSSKSSLCSCFNMQTAQWAVQFGCAVLLLLQSLLNSAYTYASVDATTSIPSFGSNIATLGLTLLPSISVVSTLLGARSFGNSFVGNDIAETILSKRRKDTNRTAFLIVITFVILHMCSFCAFVSLSLDRLRPEEAAPITAIAPKAMWVVAMAASFFMAGLQQASLISMIWLWTTCTSNRLTDFSKRLHQSSPASAADLHRTYSAIHGRLRRGNTALNPFFASIMLRDLTYIVSLLCDMFTNANFSFLTCRFASIPVVAYYLGDFSANLILLQGVNRSYTALISTIDDDAADENSILKSIDTPHDNTQHDKPVAAAAASSPSPSPFPSSTRDPQSLYLDFLLFLRSFPISAEFFGLPVNQALLAKLGSVFVTSLLVASNRSRS